MKQTSELSFTQEDPETQDSRTLLEELSTTLQAITTSTGKNSFDPTDVKVPRSIFILARDKEGKPVACGGFRPVDENIAEIKRIYVREKRKGIGRQILNYLETEAKAMNYKSLQLETRVVNKTAVSFYKAAGYHIIDNYGKYAGRRECICFAKDLRTNSEF